MSVSMDVGASFYRYLGLNNEGMDRKKAVRRSNGSKCGADHKIQDMKASLIREREHGHVEEAC